MMGRTSMVETVQAGALWLLYEGRRQRGGGRIPITPITHGRVASVTSRKANDVSFSGTNLRKRGRDTLRAQC